MCTKALLWWMHSMNDGGTYCNFQTTGECLYHVSSSVTDEVFVAPLCTTFQISHSFSVWTAGLGFRWVRLSAPVNSLNRSLLRSPPLTNTSTPPTHLFPPATVYKAVRNTSLTWMYWEILQYIHLPLKSWLRQKNTSIYGAWSFVQSAIVQRRQEKFFVRFSWYSVYWKIWFCMVIKKLM